MEILVGPDGTMLNLGALNLRRRELKFKLGSYCKCRLTL